jgi:hypothetical protein
MAQLIDIYALVYFMNYKVSIMCPSISFGHKGRNVNSIIQPTAKLCYVTTKYTGTLCYLTLKHTHKLCYVTMKHTATLYYLTVRNIPTNCVK